VTIPVMAKVRIGHFVEAQIVQAIGADYIDESEVLTAADEVVRNNNYYFSSLVFRCDPYLYLSIISLSTISAYRSSAVRLISARHCVEYLRVQP
jgi:hypothetical protein